MATHVARASLRYAKSRTTQTILCRNYVIENAARSNLLYRSTVNVGCRQMMSSDAADEVNQEKSSTSPTIPKSRNIEEITRIKPTRFDISFEEYLKLKNSVRTRQRIAGMPFAFLGLGTSSVVSAYMFPEMFDATPENVQLIMGLDPLVFCGICGVVSAGVGYALGTQLFKTLWKIINKNQARMLLEREKDFLERIQKARFASFSKFEDDYYGESIKNLSDYRQWLRTQQKKAEANRKFAKENELTEQKDVTV